MGITIQSVVGIGHSVDFWCSAENPPPQRKILPSQRKIIQLSEKSSPLSSKYPPSAENSLHSAEIPEVQGRLCLKSINNVFLHFILLGMSMEISMQSFLGIGHNVDFWRLAGNPPPSSENPPPSAENHPPSVVNIPPQQKILPPHRSYPRYKVVFA
jgi:hypothetical protein